MDYRSGKKPNRWVIRPPGDNAGPLAAGLKISRLLSQVLVNRGLTDPDQGRAFLRPSLAQLIAPELMPGMEVAAERIHRAVAGGEAITIYGDYDVDGITGVTILWRLLRMLDAKVDYYIPHRVEEGYGLNGQAVRSIAQSGTKLLVTVDCGVTASDEAILAAKLGMDVVITDHHQLPDKLPPASAVVHPALDASYGNQNSSGSMVAFKLAWAVARRFSSGSKLDEPLRTLMIDAAILASLGTVADVMDLTGENRAMVGFGLGALPGCGLIGIRALIESVGLAGKELSSYHIGFRLAPVLNAAGRMGHARLAVELLNCDDSEKAAQIAGYLKEQNSRRRQCEKKIFEQACEMIEAGKPALRCPAGIVLARQDWHTGVIGIVATRIVEKYYRPTVLIGLPDDGKDSEPLLAHGSARSIEGFDIFEAISACGEHLVGYGGHRMAAGVRVEPDRIASFAADFESYAAGRLKDFDLTAPLYIDAAVPLRAVGRATVEQLSMLEPFGPGNPQPVFCSNAVSLSCPPRKVGAGGEHLQFAVRDNGGSARCVGFRMGELANRLVESDVFDLAYRPEVNRFNGSEYVQLVVCDVRFPA